MRMSTWLVVLCMFTVGLLAESAAGLRWTAPSGWSSEAARPMRAATYRVAPAAGDGAAAECGVYFFGAGQGGSVDANVERWKGQFRGPDGKVPPARVSSHKIGGLAVTTIDTAGVYAEMGGRSSPGYRLLGAIVEGPGGNVFVKFTGPAKTIAANQQKFEQLLASFHVAK